MEKKTIAKLSISAAAVVLTGLFACGVGRGGPVRYQLPAPYTAESTNNFSTVKVEATVDGGKITECAITSSGDGDLLNDAIREEWAKSIVEHQSADNDVISGATLTYSAGSVKEATDDILVQAGLKEAVEAPAETEAPAEEPAEEPTGDSAEAAGLKDGTYTVRKTTDFSTIDVSMTVEGGKVASANIASEGANDLLTDDHRNAWAQQIVEKQAVDAVSGVTVSSNAVQEAVAELIGQASGGETDESDAKIAELEAALAEAQARADKAEARVAELEAAAKAEAPAAQDEPGPLTDGGYVVEKKTDFSSIWMFISVENGNVSSAQIASFGDKDLLTDDIRDAWAKQIVERQDVDAVSGVTVSSDAVREGLAELLERAGGTKAEPAKAEADPEAEAAARVNAILPRIVATMGDNKENSYVTDYLEQDPYLVNIYEGFGFAKDYGSARGHEYTLEDLAKTQRPHAKANCITCKTPDLHKMIEEQGVAVYSMPYDEVMPQMKNNVSCYTCHGADTGNGGALQVTHQYVNEALGDNAAAINPATLSCGQCHIEYYFTPEDSETMMPYHSAEEMTPEAILAYYDAMDFADWTQESTGTRMLKAQHPEMETVLQGKHGQLLSCADCHMPTETTEDGVEYRSHKLVSPLENAALLESCAKCHGDTDMAAYVRDIQAKTTARETQVGNRLSGMKDALAAAVASGTWSEDDLNAVRKLHREAQWFFDFCYVENAEGAHNSALAERCLDTADAKIEEALALLGLEVEPAEVEAETETASANALRLMRPRP